MLGMQPGWEVLTGVVAGSYSCAVLCILKPAEQCWLSAVKTPRDASNTVMTLNS